MAICHGAQAPARLIASDTEQRREDGWSVVRRYGEELAGMFALAAAGLALVRAGIRLVDELDTETMPSPFFTTPG